MHFVTCLIPQNYLFVIHPARDNKFTICGKLSLFLVCRLCCLSFSCDLCSVRSVAFGLCNIFDALTIYFNFSKDGGFWGGELTKSPQVLRWILKTCVSSYHLTQAWIYVFVWPVISRGAHNCRSVGHNSSQPGTLWQLLPSSRVAKCWGNELKFELVKYLRAGPTNSASTANNTFLPDISGDDHHCHPLSHLPFEQA